MSPLIFTIIYGLRSTREVVMKFTQSHSQWLLGSTWMTPACHSRMAYRGSFSPFTSTYHFETTKLFPSEQKKLAATWKKFWTRIWDDLTRIFTYWWHISPQSLYSWSQPQKPSDVFDIFFRRACNSWDPRLAGLVPPAFPGPKTQSPRDEWSHADLMVI